MSVQQLGSQRTLMKNLLQEGTVRVHIPPLSRSQSCRCKGRSLQSTRGDRQAVMLWWEVWGNVMFS